MGALAVRRCTPDLDQLGSTTAALQGHPSAVIAEFQHLGQNSKVSSSSKQVKCFDPTCRAQMQSVGATVTNMHMLALLAH